MGTKIKDLLFDLGNVLIDFNHYLGVNKIAAYSRLENKEIYDLFFDSHITERFEEGKLSSKKFHLEVNKLLNINLEYENFVNIWNDIFFLTKRNTGCLELIKKLSGKLPIAMVSNINKLHYEYLKEKFDIFGHFDKLILSFEVGARKPKKEIYEEVIKFFKCDKSKIFYTDDRADLIEAGKVFGFYSTVFTSDDKLARELRGLGLDV